MISYHVSFDNQYKKHDTTPYSDDSSSLKDPQPWDRKSLYRSTVLGSKVIYTDPQSQDQRHSCIDQLPTTALATATSVEIEDAQIHSLGIKGIYLYRFTVLGSNVYMYTDQVPFKANQHWLFSTAHNTPHRIRLREQSSYDQTHNLGITAQVHQAGCRSINMPEKNTPPKVNKHSFDSY